MLKFLSTKKASTDKQLKHDVRELLGYMVEKVPDDKEYSMLSSKVTSFSKLSADKQVDQLPQTFLLIEQYVTDLNTDEISRAELRDDVKSKFPFIAEIESLSIILLRREIQPIELSKVFLLSVLDRAYKLLGAAGDQMLVVLKEWLESVPENAKTPVPLTGEEELPKNAEGWYELLFNISHTLFNNLEKKFSESFTKKIYDKSYDEIAIKYKGLEDFSLMIRLLPVKILDASQVDLLSHKSKQVKLTGKVDDLTELNEKISRQAEELKEANEIISSKNREITESIDYAKRIQVSMMPRAEDFKKLFRKSFIFFKPRDIVSGDFFWFKKLDYRDPKFVVAAVDCTGHGVPGAFMSLIGIENFERIVGFRRKINPSDICTRIHKDIVKLGRKKQDEMQDGMDLAICTIHKRNKVLEFSGAKNNLVFFQNGNMKVFRGDRHSIGETHEGVDVFFSKQSVKLDVPTTCYIFSDGFEDQIGGRHNRKYKRVRFYKFLEHIHKEPMDKQHELLEKELHRWMNPPDQEPYHQLDDIIVMGFKIDF